MARIVVPSNQLKFSGDKPVGVWLNGRVMAIEDVEKALDKKFGTPCIAYSFVVTTENDAQDVVAIISADGPLGTFSGILHNLQIGGSDDEV